MSTGEADFLASLRDRGVLDHIENVNAGDPPAEDKGEGQPRDPESGQFIPVETPETPEAEETTEVEETEVVETEPVGEETETQEAEEATDETDGVYELEVSDEVQAYLNKFDGDIAKALKSAANAESLVGRMGNEKGELKKELDELRQLVESSAAQNAPYQAQWPNDEMEDAEQVAAYQAVAYEAIQRGDGQTFGAAIEAWKDLDPFGASVLVGDMSAQAAVAALQEQKPAVADDLATAMSEVEARNPDISQYADKIGAEMQQYPTLGRLMQEGTASERAKAFEDLYRVVKSREVRDNSRDALKKVSIRNAEEARKAREEAQVVSGGRGVGETPEVSGVDSFHADFRARTGQGMVDVAEEIRRNRAEAARQQ